MGEKQGIGIRRMVFGIAQQAVLLAAAMFWPAGTFDWPRGWVFVILSLIASIAVTVWLYRYSPSLLKERMRPPIQRDQPLDDKLVTLVFVIAIVVWLPFMPYDVFHLRLLPPPPFWLSLLGLAAWFASMWVIFVTFRANAFAAPVVKHQVERRHVVIDSGPYAVVRHPMYAGILIMAIGTPLWLGSTAGLLFAAIPMGALAVRILIEEAYLSRHLEGYAAYKQRVRWRLVPGLW